jgi:hypothetical protein
MIDDTSDLAAWRQLLSSRTYNGGVRLLLSHVCRRAEVYACPANSMTVVLVWCGDCGAAAIV